MSSAERLVGAPVSRAVRDAVAERVRRLEGWGVSPTLTNDWIEGVPWSPP